MSSEAAATGERSPSWRDPGLWALLAVGAALFWRPLFLGEVLYYRDLASFFVFTEGHAAEVLRQGSLPLWNPLRHGGMPLLGELHTSVLYPSGVLYLLLEPWRAATLDMGLHVAAGAVAGAALGRRLGLLPAGAVATGLVYGYSGYALSQVNLYSRALAHPWLPILLLLWDGWLAEGGRRRLAGILAAGLLQLLAGAPEACAVTWALMLGWAVFRPRPGERARAVGVGLALGGATLLLGAVQLLPTVELLGAGTRGGGFDFERMAVWSLHPLRLPETVVPGFLGDPDALAADGYWGGRLEGAYPYVSGIYLGALVPALALVGLLRGRWSRRFRISLAATAAFALLLAFGRHGFLLEPLATALPPLRIFRHPVKLLGLALPPLALLAGLGLETTAGVLAAERRRALAVAAGVALVALALLAVVALPASSEPLQRGLFGTSGAGIRAGLVGGATQTAAAALLGFFALLWAARRNRPGMLPPALAAVVALDLVAAGWPLEPTAPRDLLATPPAALELIRGELAGGRLYSETPGNDPVALRFPVADGVLRYRWYQEVLGALWVGPFGVPVIYHDDYSGLAPRRLLALGGLVAALPWERRLPLLAAGGVTVVATFDEVELPGLRLLARVGNASERTVQLYRVEGAARPFELATFWASVPDEETALRVLARPGFDPRRAAVVEGERRPSPDAGCADAPRVELESTSPLARAVEVESDCPGYLVHAQAFDPGWEAKVDGRPAGVVRANAAFGAVFVEAGRHRVEWRYRPASFRYGLAISLATLAVAAFVVARSPRRREGGEAAAAPP